MADELISRTAQTVHVLISSESRGVIRWFMRFLFLLKQLNFPKPFQKRIKNQNLRRFLCGGRETVHMVVHD